MPPTDPTCPVCGAPVLIRAIAGEDATVQLDVHPSPTPLREGYALRTDGRATRAGLASPHVYRRHRCLDPLAAIVAASVPQEDPS